MAFNPHHVPDYRNDQQLAAATRWLLEHAGIDATKLTVGQVEPLIDLIASLARITGASPARLLADEGHWYIQDFVLEPDGIAWAAQEALMTYQAGLLSWPALQPRARALARSRSRRPLGCRCAGLVCGCSP